MPKMAPRVDNSTTALLDSNNNITSTRSHEDDDDDEDMAVPQPVASPPRRSSYEEESSHSSYYMVGVESDEFFDTTRFLDFSRELSVVTRLWNVILGVSALLDFFAATVDSHMRTAISWETERFDPWLRRNSFELGMIFSFLWFFDSFISAAEIRNNSLREAEKARLLHEEGWEKKSKNAEWKASMEFFWSVTIQLLLLPVGFYVWVSPGDSFTLTVTHENGYSDYDETETFTSTANVSLIYAIFHFSMQNLSEMLRQKAVQHGKKSAFRWLRRNIAHPVQLARTISNLTKWIRWVRIIGPVIGTTNKLLGNSLDLVKRIKQHREAVQAAKIRRTLWLEMTDEEAMEYAATLVQSIYRAKKSRRERRALEILQGNKERFAAMKLQRRFRAALKRARKRVARKKRELEKLEEKAKKVNQYKMTDSERVRMYKLQSELAQDAHSFINKNLLRPNTTFSVVWKTTFVISVILELSTLIIHINYPELTKESLLPVPYSELKECRRDQGRSFGRILSALNRSKPKPVPRYCDDDVVALQAFGIGFMRFMVEMILVVVNFMFFFDVPISFFTGRFNPENGVLEPNPFFIRWIAPGVMLQMIVNPQMGTIAEFIATTVSKIRELGPFRVYRWTVAAFFPIFLVVAKWLFQSWSTFVALQNSPTHSTKRSSGSKQSSFDEAPTTGKNASVSASGPTRQVRLSMVARSNPNELHA